LYMRVGTSTDRVLNRIEQNDMENVDNIAY